MKAPTTDQGSLLDTVYQVETPEGIELGLRVAGPVPRAQAWALDFLVRASIYVILAIVLGLLDQLGTGLMLILMFVLEWFYPVYFEVYRQGATPGKRAMGLRVLQDNGTPVGLQASLLRNLLRGADFLPALFTFGLLAMMLNQQFKRLGDMAAGTVVVYQDKPVLLPLMVDVQPLAPPVPLPVNEQRLLVVYAERLPYITGERAEELAGLLEPLTGSQGRSSVERLRRMAAFVVGKS